MLGFLIENLTMKRFVEEILGDSLWNTYRANDQLEIL